MSDIFKGFEELLELAKTLEEQISRGEVQSGISINSFVSGIPPQGNIPRRSGMPSPIVTPPPSDTTPDPVTSAKPSQKTEGVAGGGMAKIGGLEEVLRELRELVEIGLKRPDLLAKLGLEPPRGVLLVGPPGTGKTLTARCLAEDLGVNYIAITGPEVMGKYYGEAEARLRSIFDKAAKSAPCLIFIDEIDSLAPDRAKVEGEVEKRVVGQLLGLMDGFAPNTGVIVLAATNRPNHLDPALRRPGRFDREVHFPVPDKAGRLEILHALTRSMPPPLVNLEEIASKCLGFVGADLKAVCQKAAYLALRRLVPSVDAPTPENLAVTRFDFLQAVEDQSPSVLRSVAVETPQVSWDDVGGLDEVKQVLQESVEGQLLYPELYQHTGAKAPRGILLFGPPGTGKTLLAKALASQGQANFIGVTGAELLSRWVGASEQAVRDLFAKARQAAPCVVFIDEIDTIAPARGMHSGDAGTSDRLVGQLLAELDGLQSIPNILFIAATNRPEVIDSALMRAGRLDLQLKVELPDEPSRMAILQVHNQTRPIAADVNFSEWATRTQGWNGADLALLSNQAALEAIRRARESGNTESVSAIEISQQDFDRAYHKLAAQKL
ncbi:AAA family ATPase [[Phormidium] sp. ETS-05]|uniref:AAA family ATPase n=1 Tax=[Phormidium] sp. ETS-05 TaxID=222819 RepID=UPI0018EED5CF|nr:AAA family ATPase [[Phormidium] sp. ETS-05]